MSIRAVAYDENDLRSFPVACEYKMEFIPNESDFVIDDNGVISSYNGDLREMVIPETINGITVTGITPRALSYMIGLKLPNSIKRIEDMAFYQSKLKYLDAQGVECVGFNTFYQSPLIYCNMPNLQVADESAFSETQLRELTFPELTTIGNFTFYQIPYLYSVSMPKLESISYSSFQNCWQLRFADFPSVKTVEVNAFADCYFLKKINLTNAISFNNTRNDNAFGTFLRCYNLTEINLPSALSLDGPCFISCLDLEKVNLPNAVYIGNSTFYNCESLVNIALEKAKYIDERAFYTANLSGEVSLPVVKEIANEAFCGTNITGLSLSNLEILGEGAFSDINIMTNKYVDNNRFTFLNAPKLKIVKDNAFAYLTALTTLDLPSLVEIGTNAFIGSGVSRAEFSTLETTQSLPVIENSIIALPSTFTECTEETAGRNYKIYGTKGTYAEEWALANGHEFFEISQETALLEDLPLEYTGNGEVLSPDVIGFNKTYQWYSNDEENNTTGNPIDGATDKEFNPADYPQSKYYYCVVTSTDVGYEPIAIKTSACENRMEIVYDEFPINSVETVEQAFIGSMATVKVNVDKSPEEIRFVDNNRNTITVNREDATIITDNSNGTEDWYINLYTNSIYKEYSVFAKYNDTGWNENSTKFVFRGKTLETQETIYSVELPDGEDFVIYQGVNEVRVVTNTETSKVQFYQNGNTWTYNHNNATVTETDGQKEWIINMNFCSLGDNLFAIRTRTPKTTFTVVGQLAVTVYAK